MKIYAGEYEDVADCAIVIITAGANQKPDETRLDLVAKNVGIYKHIIPGTGAWSAAKAFLLMVSNPVDILTYTALKLLRFPGKPCHWLRNRTGYRTFKISAG